MQHISFDHPADLREHGISRKIDLRKIIILFINIIENRIVIEVLIRQLADRMTRVGGPLDTASPISIGAGRMTIFGESVKFVGKIFFVPY